MGQPKKLTHAQKTARRDQAALEAALEPVQRDLASIRRAMKKDAANGGDDMGTWRWAALEVFNTLSRDFDPQSPVVKSYMNRALYLAREAQQVMNFRG